MAVPILYVQAYPDLANAGGNGDQVAIAADDGTATHLSVLATVGGLLTAHVIATGAGLTSGQYNNVPIISTIARGNAGTVNINVNAAGYILSTAITVNIPGY